MKLGVVGNCQARGLGASIAALVPSAEVVILSPDVVAAEGGRHPESLARLAARLDGCAHVFTREAGPAWGALAPAALARRGLSVITLPGIGFQGFHPDCVHVRGEAGAPVRGAMGSYNSALALACFLEGVPAERAERLFNAYVFACLGYTEVHGRQLAALRDRWAELGFDLPAALRIAPPVFMHTVNHPAIGLIFALAQQALRRAGVATVDAAPPEDGLAGGAVWPVYPGIAERLGLPGGLRFRLGRRISMDLGEMLRRSYAAYAEQPGIAASPAVERTRAVLRAELRDLAPRS